MGLVPVLLLASTVRASSLSEQESPPLRVDVPGLIAATEDPDPDVRAGAIREARYESYCRLLAGE